MNIRYPIYEGVYRILTGKVSAKIRLSETNENHIYICEREDFIQIEDNTK